jgi:hypothetical protein
MRFFLGMENKVKGVNEGNRGHELHFVVITIESLC